MKEVLSRIELPYISANKLFLYSDWIPYKKSKEEIKSNCPEKCKIFFHYSENKFRLIRII